MESLLEWVNTFSVVSLRLVRCSNISQLADPALLAAILGEMYFSSPLLKLNLSQSFALGMRSASSEDVCHAMGR